MRIKENVKEGGVYAAPESVQWKFMLKECSAAVLMNTRKYHSSGNRCLTINESRTMKKIYSFMVAAVALFAAASCNKQLPQENLPTVGETVVYTASTDGADTKAVLNETTKKSEWVENDAITVHDGEKGWTFTTAEAGANVDFSNSEGFGVYRPVLAVYPAGTYAVDVNDKTVNAYISTYQPARKGTYNEGAALAVAYSVNDQFAFKNAHALIKFTIKGTNIKAVEFYGNNSEAITGNMLVSLNEDNTIKSVVGQDTIFEEGKSEQWTGKGAWMKIYSEDEANGWCFEDGATYYAAVAPAYFTKGVSINYILADDTKIDGAKKAKNRVNLTASTILNIGELEFTGTIEPEEPEEVAVDYWAVVGSMTGNWNSEIGMTLDGDWYVAEGIELTATDQFKFRANGDAEWTINRGAEGAADGVIIADNVETTVVQGGKNFAVAIDGVYSLYINKYANKAKVVRTGDIVIEEPGTTTPGENSEWAVYAQFGSETWSEVMMKTTTREGLFVVENTTMEAYNKLLIKKYNDSDWKVKYGSYNVNYIKPDRYFAVASNGGDIFVEAAGTYDIYFDYINTMVYLMSAGTDYTSATEQIESGDAPVVETGTWLYLKPNSNWLQGNARFAVNTWDGGQQWFDMKDSDSDGIYEVLIPEGISNIIFCRMNPSTTANNWDNKWNQTSDLKVPTDGTNLYTVKDDTWDKGGGTWSVK